MKKKIIILLSAIVLLTTGCNITTLSDVDIGRNLKTLLNENVRIYNVYFDGYKYYVPKGMNFLYKEDYNATLVDKMGNKYFLYVDAISYFHKVENTYKENNESHYSKKIKVDNKEGYIQIDEQEDGYYLVQFMYNYAKMETYVKERDLVSAVDNMTYILRSVKYNRKVLESLIGDNILSFQEENFSLFDTNTTKADFLDVVSEYENENYSKDLDEDVIVIEEE